MNAQPTTQTEDGEPVVGINTQRTGTTRPIFKWGGGLTRSEDGGGG